MYAHICTHLCVCGVCVSARARADTWRERGPACGDDFLLANLRSWNCGGHNPQGMVTFDVTVGGPRGPAALGPLPFSVS